MTAKIKVVYKGVYDSFELFEAKLQEAYAQDFQVTHLATDENRVVAILEKDT
jgi:hypothetical protein